MTPRETTIEHVAYLAALAIIKLEGNAALAIVSFRLQMALRETSPFQRERHFSEAYRIIEKAGQDA